MTDMAHGTVQMYRKELRQKKAGGAGPCDECKAAQARYIFEYRTLHGRSRSSTDGPKTARRKAVARLIEEYPARFTALLEEEVALATLL